MPYIGNTPALDYISYAVQNFTVTAGTTVYTLDYSVANENDIRLVINNVIQRPGASYAYSATGTTLTLTSATLSTDTMYAVFIGRAVQTVTPPANINIQLADGSASAPSLNFANDTNTGIFRPTADTLAFTEGGTEAMRIDSSGNLAIGTTAAFSDGSGVEIQRAGVATLRCDNSTATSAGEFRADATGTAIDCRGLEVFRVLTGGAERMRIEADGDVVIGDTSTAHKLKVVDANNRTEGTAQFAVAGSGYSIYNFLDATAAYIGQNSNGRELRMYAGSTPTTGVKLTAGATSWVSTSDETLKDIIEPIENAVEKISTLRAVIGKYKDDADDIRRPFLIAQDVEKVLPEAIHIGVDQTLNLAYTETIPLLVAGIKEQQAIIEELKATLTSQQSKIDALEARLTTLENN